MPYVGYQIIQAQSPGAGVYDGVSTPAPTQEELDQELNGVNDLKKSSLIFGVTVLKRIVPGWFIRLDMGSDLLNAGLALEF